MSVDELLRLADANGGVFNTADAEACGVTRSALRHRLATGEWRRLRRGVFADARLCVPGAEYDRTPELTSLAAAVAAVGPSAAVSHHSAAALLGLATYGRPPSWVSITLPRRPPASCDSLARLRVRRSRLDDGDVWEVGGVPVTSPARTAVDVAWGAVLRGGVVVLDAALRAGCTFDELSAAIGRQRRWPGVLSARRALVVADPGSESPLESLAHVCQYEAGLPRPVTQVEIRDDHGLIGRVDDYWPEHRVVGESDGMVKYADPHALRTEKLRQERLEQVGLRVVRVTYADVTSDAPRTRDRYRAAFPHHDFADRMVARRGRRSTASDRWLGKVEGWGV